MEIHTDYPLWFILLCLLLGGLYSFILYFRDKDSEFSQWKKRVLALFRFIAVSLIAFLLLGPLIKSRFKNIEKPLIIIAQDNSSSLMIGEDSTFMKNEYIERINELIENLSADYGVKAYTYGEKFSDDFNLTFNDNETDFSEVFGEINARYANRNIGALIIASDGIYNSGLNPLYSSQTITYPIYTIALGDTLTKKDVIVDKVNYNKITYQGNEFPLEVVIRAEKSKGMSAVLMVKKNDNILIRRDLNINNDDFIKTIPFKLKAEEKGMQHYVVEISDVTGEVSTANNRADIFIDVIDSEQRILILSNSPHPDIAAIKSAVKDHVNYKVEQYNIEEYNKPVKEYSLVILHQLPSLNTKSGEVLKQINEAGIPTLFIIGIQTDLDYFNRQSNGLKIYSDSKTFEDVFPSLNNNFVFFKISKKLNNTIDKLPPLFCPFGIYNLATSAQVLFYQKIKSTITDYPLIVLINNPLRKTGVITGVGIWRWRLADYSLNGNRNSFNEIVRKIVQYLTVKSDKSFFRVKCQNEYSENDPIEFTAELYNKSYELINDHVVNIFIEDAEGTRYPFVFSSIDSSYYLNAGKLPVGKYNYTAIVNTGNFSYTEKGEFIVKKVFIEATQTIADHNMLFRLAEMHGGELIYPSNMADLPTIIRQHEEIKPVSYYHKRYTDMINIFWLLIIIVSLLSVEWLARKLSGSY